VEVTLDLERVLTDQHPLHVLQPGTDYRAGPASFAIAHQAGIGFDFDQAVAAVVA
jgi:hypothetical protein